MSLPVLAHLITYHFHVSFPSLAQMISLFVQQSCVENLLCTGHSNNDLYLHSPGKVMPGAPLIQEATGLGECKS